MVYIFILTKLTNLIWCDVRIMKNIDLNIYMVCIIVAHPVTSLIVYPVYIYIYILCINYVHIFYHYVLQHNREGYGQSIQYMKMYSILIPSDYLQKFSLTFVEFSFRIVRWYSLRVVQGIRSSISVLLESLYFWIFPGLNVIWLIPIWVCILRMQAD